MPPGLGSHVHWDRRLDARLAGAVMGIQAIKGVEIGDGFQTATRRGSVAHDEIEKDSSGKIVRRTDRAGGTEGGMSNGEILRVRAAMKPISTVPKALDTIDVSNSIARKISSPSTTKMSVIFLFAFNSINSSVSMKGHCRCAARACPTVLFPLPGAPIKTMRVMRYYLKFR